ncbi:MAG: MFS transporter [Rhodobacteraceae bacterium]|nr:MFS transporter [Paracoccaceae bacterium]
MSFASDLYLSRKPAKAFVLMGVVWAVFAATMPDLKSQIGASDAAFGVAFMIANLSAFGAAWCAPRADHLLGRFGVAVMGLMMALGLLGMGASPSVVVFMLFGLWAALMSGICDILMNARVVEAESRSGRPLMNLNHALFSFSYAGAALVTGVLRDAGWSPLETASLVVLIALLFMPGMIIAPEAAPAAGSLRPKRGGRVVIWLLGLVVMASFITETTVETWSALHLERSLGGTAAQGALGPALIGITMGLGRLLGQAVASRFSDIAILGVTCIVSACGMVGIGLAPNLMVAYLGLSVLGFGIALVYPMALSMVGRIVPAPDRVRAIGLATIIGYSAFFIGPSLVGISADLFGLHMAFVLIGALMAGVALMILPMIARRATAEV